MLLVRCLRSPGFWEGLAPLMIRSYGFPILLSIRPISRYAMSYFRSPCICLNRKLSTLHLFFTVLTDIFKICLYCRMDEYTIQPLHLKILQRLLDDVTLQWCKHNLPAPSLECADTLSALEVAFGTTEMDMR